MVNSKKQKPYYWQKLRWIVLSGFGVKSTPYSYVCILSHVQNVFFPITLNKLQLSFMFSITVYWKFAVCNNIPIRKFLLNSSTVLLIFCLQIFCLGTCCDFIFLTVTVLHSGNAICIDRRHCPHLVSCIVRPASLRESSYSIFCLTIMLNFSYNIYIWHMERLSHRAIYNV